MVDTTTLGKVMTRETDVEVKERVRQQFAGSGDAYVTSLLHASGPDLARTVELAAPRPGDRLLDIATGGGHVALAFAPLVAAVVASDLTPEMLAQAERFLAAHGIANASFRQADAEQLPFPDACFDIVTCRIAPHHFPHPERFVAEVARVLKPEGRFLLEDSTVPEGDAGVFFNAFERGRDPSHVRSLTIGQWTDLLRASGFAVRAVETFRKRHDFAEWTARSRLPAAERPRLAATMLAASPELQTEFAVERDGDRLIAFTDAKTLFLAVRSRT